jgi:hypothetical protein
VADQDASFVISARDATKEAFQSATANLQGLGERANEVKELMHQLAAAFAIHEIAHFIGKPSRRARSWRTWRSRRHDSAQSCRSSSSRPCSRERVWIPSRAAMAKLTRSIGEARAGNTEKEAFLRRSVSIPRRRTIRLPQWKRLRSMERVTDKNAAGVASNQLLGRSYAELRPLAHEVAQAKELAASATDEEVERAKAVSEEYTDLKFKIEQKVRVMAEQLLPTLQNVIGAFEDTADEAGNLSEQGEVLAP